MSKTEQHLQRQTPILDSIKSSVAKITQGGVSSDLTSVQQVGIFGSDGSDWKAVSVNSSGHLAVDIDMATDGLATQATLADLDTRIGDSIHAGNQTFGETQSGRIMVTSMGRDASGATMRAISIDGDGHQQVDVLSSALPTGASTSALQTSGNTTLTSIDTRIADSVNTGATSFGEASNGRIVTYSFGRDASGGNMKAISIDGDGHQQVDVLSSALPSGASTSALQTTGNTSLATIAGDTTSLDGKVTACNTGAVVISSSALPSGASTSALQGTGNTSLASIDGKVILPSALTGSGNLKVAIEEGQITGFATSTLQGTANGHLSTIAGDTTSLDGKVTACNTGAVVISSSALPSGASTSALQGTANGHLSTIAGDTTSLDSKLILPSALTSGGSLKTAILEDSSKTFATSTLMSTVTIAGGANTNSSTLDLGTTNPPDDVMFMITNSASKSAVYTVHISPDNSNFFEFQPTALSASSRGTFFFSLKHHLNTSPMRYMRVNVSNTSGDSSNYSVVAGHYSD